MPDLPPVIAVTGAAGYVGQLLVARLEREPSVQTVLAVDVRPPSGPQPAKVIFVRHSVLDPLEELFQARKVQAVVHLAFLLRQRRDPAITHRVNVEGTRNLLRACHAAQVGCILYLSSTTVYGPHPDNPVPLLEESPPRPLSAFQYAAQKLESERLFQAYAQDVPAACVSILRGCVVMGPSARNFITKALFKPILIGVLGYDPPLQFLHENDLVELLVLFLAGGHPGVYNVAGPGGVPYSALVRVSRRRCLWLPPPLAYGITNLTWALRLQNDSPGVGLDFIRYPWVAGTDKLRRETGYVFRYTSEQALRAFVERAR